MHDEMLFVDEVETRPDAGGPPWLLLIVDDDASVHEVTRLGLAGFSFDGRGVDFLSAYSARQAAEILRQRSDVAVILLDVVMESEMAGLDLVNDIRSDLNNRDVRIVLRTGQAGHLSEYEVLRDYDINDYRVKSELTRQKLVSACLIALRGYRDVCRARDTGSVPSVC